MITVVLLFSAALLALFCIESIMRLKDKPKIRVLSYSLHIQSRTEEAETMDFAVNLYGDESAAEWQVKMDKAFEMTETRRGFNNTRMQEEYVRIQKEAQAAKDKEQKN